MINIVIAGDFCSNYRVSELLIKNEFGAVFDSVRPLIQNANYSIVNLEAPIIQGTEKPIEKCGPSLSTPENVINAILYTGFKMTTLANNHFYDYGDGGVENTLNLLNRNNIDIVGGGISLNEAQKYNIKQINDKNIAFINVCENEFSIATESTGGSNPLDLVSNFYQIREAKEKADYVVVIVHGGHEGYQLPSPRMKKTYRFFIDIGADVVVNHHQHCFSGYEIYNNKPIFYGLGNFCFDWEGERNNIWNEGYLVELIFDTTISFRLHPYVQCDDEPSVCLHDTKKAEQFMIKTDHLNSIIINDTALNEEFMRFCSSKKTSYNLHFEPYTNMYARSMRLHGLIPSFISKLKKNIIYNLFRCESHRDVMMNIKINK